MVLDYLSVMQGVKRNEGKMRKWNESCREIIRIKTRLDLWYFRVNRDKGLLKLEKIVW